MFYHRFTMTIELDQFFCRFDTEVILHFFHWISTRCQDDNISSDISKLDIDSEDNPHREISSTRIWASSKWTCIQPPHCQWNKLKICWRRTSPTAKLLWEWTWVMERSKVSQRKAKWSGARWKVDGVQSCPRLRRGLLFELSLSESATRRLVLRNSWKQR